MKKLLLITTTAAFMSGLAAFGAQAATPSCAENATKVQSALKTAKLTAAEKTSVEGKIKTADAACKAKKDAEANTDYEAVLKILKK